MNDFDGAWENKRLCKTSFALAADLVVFEFQSLKIVQRHGGCQQLSRANIQVVVIEF